MLFKIVIVLIFINFVAAGPKSHSRKTQGDNFWDPLPARTSPKWNNKNSVSFRLPNNTIPLHYDIYLVTDVHIPNFDFFGTVTINIRVIEDSSTITLNYRQIDIFSVDIFSSDGKVLEYYANFELIEELEFLIINSNNPLLQNSEYKVKIRYRGILRTDDYGFYRASYLDEEGSVRWLATTQFQATDARHAFPCYDEPQIRASVVISIRHHESFKALSNMPVESVIFGPIRGYLITRFQKIPSIQTYLVAFTVCDFIYVENATVVPPQRVYARIEAINNNEASLALQVSPEIMITCEKYFGISYTFPKMDQIAITDFDAGAMENWGLVSYREIFLLFDPLTRTTRNKEWIISIIAHEFVHQWIGNIVTPQWWTYLWINEGFATLYEYHMSQLTFPEERFDDIFLVDIMQRVFVIDADPDIRPMSYYVEDPVSIDYLFDWIAYEKAGSVLQTFMYGFGTKVFQNGARNYIKDRFHNYGNAEHLYAALQREIQLEANINVAEFMGSWEHQSGFPLITVSREADNNIIIRQERFFYDADKTSDNLWILPINFATASNPDFIETEAQTWLRTESAILDRNFATKSWNSDDWIIFNVQQKYYYRVNYDSDIWGLIIDQLNKESEGYTEIHLRNRAQLIDDSFHLGLSEKLSYSILINLMNYLWQETDYIPWVVASRAHVFLNRWLSGSSIYNTYQKFMRHNTKKYFEKLGVEFRDEELILERYARSVIVSLACQAQSNDCLNKTNQELVKHLENDKIIAPDYLSLIFCQGTRIAGSFHFDKLQKKLLDSIEQSERNRIIDGLGCTQDMELLLSFISLAISPEVNLTVSERNRMLITSATNGENSINTLINFTNERFSEIMNTSPNLINNLLSSIANNIGSEKTNSNFKALIDNLLDNQIITSQDYEKHRDAAGVNLEWQAKNLDDIAEFFKTWEPRILN